MKLLKSARASGTLGLVALAIIASPLAAADDSGPYLGGSVGLSKAKIDDARITSSLLASGFATTSIDDDNRHVGYKLFGGYQFNKFVALEAGYFDLGKFGFQATTNPPGTLSGTIKLRGVNLDVLGIVPFTEKFSAFARAGVTYVEAKDFFSGTGSVSVPNPNRKKRASEYKFGVGFEYDFAENFGMRIEAERYRIDDAVGNKGDIDLFSGGVIARFGGKPPAPAPRAAPAPAPRPMAAVPPPPPRPPPPPAPRKVVFSADALFDFDKRIIKPAGKRSLDKFAADLRSTKFDVITVTGHTDRLGAHAYNMDLSTRRAEAVKNYLVSAGIPAGKISARGTDGSDPVTKPGECKGTKRTKELIACLQPDRRVEVEVSGTR